MHVYAHAPTSRCSSPSSSSIVQERRKLHWRYVCIDRVLVDDTLNLGFADGHHSGRQISTGRAVEHTRSAAEASSQGETVARWTAARPPDRRWFEITSDRLGSEACGQCAGKRAVLARCQMDSQCQRARCICRCISKGKLHRLKSRLDHLFAFLSFAGDEKHR